MFDSVGFALEDFSALRYLLRIHQEERGAAAQIDLVPDLEDPKDLFALLAPAAGRMRSRRARCRHERAAARPRLIGAPTDVGAGRSRRIDGT